MVTNLQGRPCNNACMNFLRTAALVLFALLVPGGLVVLVPAFYRLLIERRAKRRARASIRPTAANSEASA